MNQVLPIINLNNVTKYYNKDGIIYHVLEDVNLTINEGGFKSILAPYSSGKSTILKIMAGLEQPTSGKVDKNEGRIVFIPSKPSSFPWLNVRENIEIAIKQNVDKEEVSKVQKFIDLTGLTGYENHFPNNKSIGFRFRIALARALAVYPSILLIDEPFNLLDQETKKEIYLLLRNVFSQLNITIVLTTSNISEAIFLSDSIVLMQANPTRIFNEVKISLPNERDLSLFSSSEFIEIRKEIEESYKAEQSQALSSFLV